MNFSASLLLAAIHQCKDALSIAIQLLFKLSGMELLNYFLEIQVPPPDSSLSMCLPIVTKNSHTYMTHYFLS